MQPGCIHFLTGGVRSGKSSRAEAIARATSSEVVYVATCATSETLDAEMIARLGAHRRQRPPTWALVENRFDLDGVFAENPGRTILVDCLTLWLAWWSCLPEAVGEQAILEKLRIALDLVPALGVRLIVVSNELGMGLVPLGPENRAYRDLCGRANQLVARHADVVEFIVAGLPLKLK